MPAIYLRPYATADNEAIFCLFYDTVHTVNAAHYPSEQLAVWARADTDSAVWCQPFATDYTLVAIDDDTVGIVGFGNLTADGELDRLYIHKDYQRRGIATKIADGLEQQTVKQGLSRIATYASLTAQPFFEGRGYVVVRENIVKRDGQRLKNFYMEKTL